MFMNEQQFTRNMLDEILQTQGYNGVTIHINYFNVNVTDNGRFPHPIQPNAKSTLAQKMALKFDDRELKTAVFNLGIDYEELEGKTKTEKIQSLIGFCERRDILSKLVAMCKRERPQVEWPQLSY
jgi:hypothetical protein